MGQLRLSSVISFNRSVSARLSAYTESPRLDHVLFCMSLDRVSDLEYISQSYCEHAQGAKL